MNKSTLKPTWERPEMVRMDAADAKLGVTHHADSAYFRRTVAS